MQAAAKARDAQAFNEHVDVAKLRDNLKGQLGARLAGAIGPDAQGSEARRAGTALGTALGVALRRAARRSKASAWSWSAAAWPAGSSAA